jgi:meso-butanediol dehydrogenase / (S,S)-butanediol dehydrogenase / diacetyl reductase
LPTDRSAYKSGIGIGLDWKMGALESKVALITGAASGIGLRTAERCAMEGASVVLADRAVSLDVTCEADWIRAIAEVESDYGRLDILVNNAGAGRFQMISDMRYADWQRMIAVNLDSAFLGTKYAMPLLARSGRGAIVNISSIRGHVAGLGTAGYAAAKAGVLLLTKSTALECAAAGNGVRANAVSPGHVETPLTDGALGDADARRAMISDIPLSRMAQPQEIADAIIFLASDQASFITGSEVLVDGGFTAR